jgi:titin
MRAVRIALCLPSAIIIGCDGATSVLSPRESASFSQSNGSGAYSLSVTALSPNSVALAWADLSSNETGYEVQRSSTGATGQFAVVATIGANSTSFRDDGLAATSSYCYRVASWRSTGRKVNYSAFSDVACATTKLAPPANAHAATGSSTSATLTWTGGAGTAAGFRVERAASESGPWASVATTPGTTTTFTDPGRTPEEQVCYRVIGLTSSEETNPSNTACMAPLAAPSNLAASASADGVELTWQDNSSLEFTYVVEQSTDGVSFSLLASVPGNVTSYHVGGVTSAARYWYRVRAQRADVASDFSNTASATGG